MKWPGMVCIERPGTPIPRVSPAPFAPSKAWRKCSGWWNMPRSIVSWQVTLGVQWGRYNQSMASLMGMKEDDDKPWDFLRNFGISIYPSTWYMIYIYIDMDIWIYLSRMFFIIFRLSRCLKWVRWSLVSTPRQCKTYELIIDKSWEKKPVQTNSQWIGCRQILQDTPIYHGKIPWWFPVTSLTLWLFNIAMENGPFIDGLPFLKMVIFHGELLNNQRVFPSTNPLCLATPRFTSPGTPLCGCGATFAYVSLAVARSAVALRWSKCHLFSMGPNATVGISITLW